MYHESLKRGVSPDSFWTMTPAEVSSVIASVFYSDELMWNHTASLMTMTANINAPKGKTFKPQQFNPYSKQEEAQVSKKKAQELYNNFKNF